MKPQAARLMVTAALFLGWLGYLGYLVVCRPHTPGGLRGAFVGRPVTLSRPQFLVSTLDIVAEVSGEKGEKVVVKEVLYPKNDKDAPVKVGETIQVDHIDLCHPVPDQVGSNANPPSDYDGPGEYLLPLQPVGNKDAHHFQVVPTPPSPGFPQSGDRNVGPPRIYPATPEIFAEYKAIDKR
jgi:hypothetical protein